MRKKGIYERYLKRLMDIAFASITLVALSPIYLVLGILIKVKLGSPILFTQDRPGQIGSDGREVIFKMYKFRSMTNEIDEDGNLLPDEVRLTKFGKWLRSTSLDELPEVINILNGSMSIIGPRPQLVRDMVFMSEDQRYRHTARPGLSGLAQVNGRNEISWEEKFNWDLKYISEVSFWNDVTIIFSTIGKAFIKHEGISQSGMATAEDYGDYLLRKKAISQEEYLEKQKIANRILKKEDGIERKKGLVSIIMPSYNTAQFIEDAVQSVLKQSYTNWELIIVDDCSTDNTPEILKGFNDDRIRCIINPDNRGAAYCRNLGLREANGEWIAFLDSDDLWLPEKLETQIQFMEKNGYAFSYTNYEEIDVNGQKNGTKVTGPRKITQTGMFNYCWPGCLTVMYNANTIGLIQIENIKKNNDYAMWLKICTKADCYLLNQTTGFYRRGRQGSISTHSLKTLIYWHYKLFREAESMGRIPSTVNTIRNMIFGAYKKKIYVKR